MAQNLWYASADAWSDRMFDARSAAIDETPGARATQVWATGFGSSARKYTSRQAFTALGATSTRDLSYKQDYDGAQIGADRIVDFGGGALLLGVTTGYTGSGATFRQTSDKALLNGFNVGAYASWIKRRFFANALVKGDWYKAKLNLQTVPAIARFDATSYGGMGEVGYRLPLGAVDIVPTGSLAYVNSNLDDYTAAASVIRFKDAESLPRQAGPADRGSAREHLAAPAALREPGRRS